MFKKILCLAMVLVMVASMAVIGVSAADDTKIYFEMPSDWSNYKSVFCHIWPYGGDALATWQSKKEKCVDAGNGLFSYDTTKVGGLQAGVTYCVIFSADTGMQTFDTLMSTACLGDTVYCDGTTFENPEDSNKTAIAAYWKNQSKSVYGPVLTITSIGNFVGTCAAQSASAMFTDFITGKKLASARANAGKSDQELIDDVANALGLGQDTVEKLIKDSGVSIDWKKAESAAPEKDDTSKVPSNPAATATGQETTIVYIAIAMMLASAAVVFFARKKRVTE